MPGALAFLGADNYFVPMTLYQFKSLSEGEQGEALWEHGVHIATRKSMFYTLALYQLEDFYVEVIYDGVANRIKKLKSFSSTTLLEPYLEQISIDNITQH